VLSALRRDPDRELRPVRERGSLTSALPVYEPRSYGGAGSALYLDLEPLLSCEVEGYGLLQPYQQRNCDRVFGAAASGNRGNGEYEHHERRDAHEPMVARGLRGTTSGRPSQEHHRSCSDERLPESGERGARVAQGHVARSRNPHQGTPQEYETCLARRPMVRPARGRRPALPAGRPARAVRCAKARKGGSWGETSFPPTLCRRWGSNPHVPKDTGF
jgi:hypothetical protein